ncbi:ABC transporter substrate-binding protein (plasmid) [Deinococcus sp. KNUC1210]|uniref:ABC transporter substrate-binding protein n=1 Tax=Deinococcus sp. KNUC1210 TaxID=2917691 RepID=UPI001EF04664|nr:ABC transporter substrate-binding protein [Deinococcus sp. KNUC1210]ULH14119.1 ABC transporter substrate-binding protein [Deinococcus sp. KNUC1210]
MSQPPPDKNARRTVLKSLALTVAASYAGVGTARAAQATEHADSGPLKVGVLLPVASRYPELSERYLAGLSLALNVPGVQLLTRLVGSRPADLETAARGLLTSEGVHMLVALGDGLQERLRGLADHHHVPLIVSELGGLMPRGESSSAFVFSNSLQLWQAQWALGAWSARNLGRRVQVVTSLLESGYDLPYAFGAGVESAGGTVLHTSLADSFAGEIQSAEVLSHSRELRPDHLHFIASESQTLDFVAAYGRSLHRLPPLTASGLALGESLRPVGGSRGIRSALSWAADLDLPVNRRFAQAYQRRTGRAPDALGALGFETGEWTLQALAAVQGHHSRTQAWLQALGSAKFSGPRGDVSVDAHRRAQAPLYLRVSAQQGSAFVHRLAGQLAAPPTHHRALQVLLESPRSGWLGTYLHA